MLIVSQRWSDLGNKKVLQQPLVQRGPKRWQNKSALLRRLCLPTTRIAVCLSLQNSKAKTQKQNSKAKKKKLNIKVFYFAAVFSYNPHCNLPVSDGDLIVEANSHRNQNPTKRFKHCLILGDIVMWYNPGKFCRQAIMSNLDIQNKPS